MCDSLSVAAFGLNVGSREGDITTQHVVVDLLFLIWQVPSAREHVSSQNPGGVGCIPPSVAHLQTAKAITDDVWRCGCERRGRFRAGSQISCLKRYP